MPSPVQASASADPAHGATAAGPDKAARPAAAPARLPSRLRFALVMAVGVYPLITALLYAITPLTQGWATWQRTLILVPLMVGAIVWGITPFIHKRLGRLVTMPAQR